MLFAVTFIAPIIHGKDLRCTKNCNCLWGSCCCFLEAKETITSEMEGNNFTFSGLSNYDKSSIDVVVFRTSSIAFVPKEVFTEFPKISKIGFSNIHNSLPVIRHSWLESFLKYLPPSKIKTLILYNSGIGAVEPKAFSLLKRFDSIELESNTCIDAKVANIATLESALAKCTKSYIELYGWHDIYKEIKELSTNFNSSINKVNNDMESLNVHKFNVSSKIEDLEEALGDHKNVTNQMIFEITENSSNQINETVYEELKEDLRRQNLEIFAAFEKLKENIEKSEKIITYVNDRYSPYSGYLVALIVLYVFTIALVCLIIGYLIYQKYYAYDENQTKVVEMQNLME